MSKRDKLYTVNRWNLPAFIPKEHKFDWGGLARADYNQYLDNNTIGSSIYAGAKTPEEITEAYKNSTNIFGLAKKDNPFSKGNLAGGPKAMLNTGIGKGIAGAVSGLVGNAAYNALSGGLNSGAGSAISGLGKGISSAIPNPLLSGLLEIGSDTLGGVINAAIGTGVDEAKLNAANAGTAAYNNFNSNAGAFDDVHTATAQANVEDAYSSGFLNSSWAEERNAELKRKRMEARQWADRSVDNNVSNLVEDQLAASYANSTAFGGQLEQGGDNMGAINYDFMDRYLTNYRDKNAGNDTMTNLFAGTPSTMFAFGGNLEAHGADFSTRLMHIDEGGTHSENPYDGVQLGTDNEGVPNLVEEGEVVYDDYVFSNRILLDETAKKKFHFPLKKDITYADAAKKLEKEIEERPNDPISKAGFKAQMEQLEEEQERQKQEMEATRAREAFEALSPEEQTALMQRAAQEESMAQQAAMQEQAAAQQQASQAMPEGAMMQQPTADAMGTVATPEIIQGGGQAPVMAEGGHLYAEGSKIRRGVYKALGFHTDKEFLDWARKHKLRGDDKWEIDEDGLKNLAEDDESWQALISDPTFAEAIKGNPALVHALANKYNFGAYTPNNTDNVTFKDISKGNWTAQDYEGWKESQDPAWLEAVKRGLVKEGMGQEDIAKALRQTNAYQKGNKWLQDSEDNRLRYLRTVLEDENSPDAAKNYAKKFIDANGWKQGVARDYASIFGTNGKGVRETNPGTYWHTPIEAIRGAQAKNFAIGDDGTVEEIIGDVPTDWKAAGNYSWATPENDFSYSYYRRPEAAVTKEKPQNEDTEKPKDEEEKKVVPKLRDERLRYLGLLGPAVGLGLQAAGVGRPDTSGLFAAANGAGNVHLAKWKPIGNYLTYNPIDIWFEQNRMDANARATDRAIMNNASPVGTKMAGLLANGYTSLLADGELNRKALEYNDAKKERVEAFNRGTNQYNADAYTRNSQFNAEALNRANQYKAGLLAQAARKKMNADAGWYQGIYGNISNLFKGFSDLGRENVSHNEVAKMWADGIGGVATPKTNVASKYLAYPSAKGGKIKRKKRGLTC